MGDDLKPYLEPYAKPRWVARRGRRLSLGIPALWGIRCTCERLLYSDGSCGNCDDDGDPGPFLPAEEE